MAKKKPAKSKSSAPTEDSNVARLRQIVEIMEASSLASLEYEDEDIEVRLSRVAAAPAAAPVAAAPVTATPLPAPSVPEPAPAATDEPEGHVVRSPIVGTFYRAPSPTAPPFAAAGQRISKGQPLCIIEAMKLMNEIECDVSGTVLEVLVENAQPVQYDQPLFRIAVDD